MSSLSLSSSSSRFFLPLLGCGVLGAVGMYCLSKSPSPSVPSVRRRPVVVTVTGAAGQIGYSIVFMIASGRMLGPSQSIELRLLDLPQMTDVLKGIEMEISDCAFPLVSKVVCTSDYETAFRDCEVALLIGARPRGPGMDRKDLLRANAGIFEGQGKALDKFASRNVKVLVVGNPANTNALIAMTHAPSLPKTAFSAMTRLDQNRATAQIASRVGVPCDSVRNIIVWGNHSSTQFPDVSIATVDVEGKVGDAESLIGNDEYLRGEFIKTVQGRGAVIIEQMKKSSAASAANAAVDHMRDWWCGTPEGTIVSMAVCSDSNPYGVPGGLVYSFPCICSNGQYSIVGGLKLNEFQKQKLKLTADELIAEKSDAFGTN